MKRMLAVGYVVLHHFHPSVALACGATPDVFLPMLPEADAGDVPRDAALFVASNHSESIEFTLAREDLATEDMAREDDMSQSIASDGTSAATQADGGAAALGETSAPGARPTETLTDGQLSAGDATNASGRPGADAGREVPLAVRCYPVSGGNLCVAKPKAPLDASASYSWTARAPRPNASESAHFAIAPQRFRTSDAFAHVGSPQVNVEVVGHHKFTNHPCGLQGSVTLSVTATGLFSPLLVNARGLTPSYVVVPVVVSPSQPEQPFALYGTPECFVMEAFDVTGARSEVREVCPEQELPAVSDVAPPASSQPVASEPAVSADWPGMSESESMDGRSPGISGDEPDAAAGGSDPSKSNDVERRYVEPKSNSGCAVGRANVGQHLFAAAWLAIVGFVVGLRRARHAATATPPVLAPKPTR